MEVPDLSAQDRTRAPEITEEKIGEVWEALLSFPSGNFVNLSPKSATYNQIALSLDINPIWLPRILESRLTDLEYMAITLEKGFNLGRPVTHTCLELENASKDFDDTVYTLDVAVAKIRRLSTPFRPEHQQLLSKEEFEIFEKDPEFCMTVEGFKKENVLAIALYRLNYPWMEIKSKCEQAGVEITFKSYKNTIARYRQRLDTLESEKAAR